MRISSVSAPTFVCPHYFLPIRIFHVIFPALPCLAWSFLQVYYLWLAYTDWTNQVYLHLLIWCQAKSQSWKRHLLVEFSIKPLIFSFLPRPPSSEKCDEVTNCSGSMPQVTLALSKGYLYRCWWEIPLSWLLYPPLWTITLSETNGWKDRPKFLWQFAFFLPVMLLGGKSLYEHWSQHALQCYTHAVGVRATAESDLAEF